MIKYLLCLWWWFLNEFSKHSMRNDVTHLTHFQTTYNNYHSLDRTHGMFKEFFWKHQEIHKEDEIKPLVKPWRADRSFNTTIAFFTSWIFYANLNCTLFHFFSFCYWFGILILSLFLSFHSRGQGFFSEFVYFSAFSQILKCQ